MKDILTFVILASTLLAGCSSATAAAPLAGGEPLVTVEAPTPAVATVTSPPGEPKRVEFATGTYGTTVQATGVAQYVLWAAAGQVVRVDLAGGEGCAAQLYYGEPGAGLFQLDGTIFVATLAQSGDHILHVECAGDFSWSIDIRHPLP